jgi:hypothetical protein
VTLYSLACIDTKGHVRQLVQGAGIIALAKSTILISMEIYSPFQMSDSLIWKTESQSPSKILILFFSALICLVSLSHQFAAHIINWACFSSPSLQSSKFAALPKHGLHLSTSCDSLRGMPKIHIALSLLLVHLHIQLFSIYIRTFKPTFLHLLDTGIFLSSHEGKAIQIFVRRIL